MDGMHGIAAAVNNAMCFCAADLLTLAELPLHSRWQNKSEQDRKADEPRSWQAGKSLLKANPGGTAHRPVNSSPAAQRLCLLRHSVQRP